MEAIAVALAAAEEAVVAALALGSTVSAVGTAAALVVAAVGWGWVRGCSAVVPQLQIARGNQQRSQERMGRFVPRQRSEPAR